MAATKIGQYNEALRLLGQVRLVALTDDVEARYALDDAWDGATDFVLRQAPWKFALKTAPLATGGTVLVGYTISYAKPADWLRTHELFVQSAAPGSLGECPIDIREQGINFSTNAATARIRYVSSAYRDPALANNPWPEHFAKVHAAYLAFSIAARVNASASEAGRMSQLFASLLPEAVAHDAVPESEWLPYQLSGAFAVGSRDVMSRGFWRHGLKEARIDVSQQLATTAAVALPYRFAKPDDWLRTHAMFVPWDGSECPFNIRETSEDWSTAEPSFIVRYLSTAVLDATTWPEAIHAAVLAYLKFSASDGDPKVTVAISEKLLADAVRLHAMPADPWLRFQFDGSYVQGVKAALERARWRFSIRTVALVASDNPTAVSDGAISPGYTYRFLKPNDWMRTIWLYYAPGGAGGARHDLDYREELDAYHTNYSPVELRYLSRLGLDSTRWSPNFRDAVLAWLRYVEEPTAANLAFFDRQSEDAEGLDDGRERPRVNTTGRFVAGRSARGGYTGVRGEQGWWP